MKLLYVEDDPACARRLRKKLRGNIAQPCDVIHVKRLSDAIARLQAEYFDAVLLDLTLPDSTGVAACSTLREASATVPIVVVTSDDDDTIAVNAVQSGAQDYLIKGAFHTQTLVRRVRYAIERLNAGLAGSATPSAAQACDRVECRVPSQGGTALELSDVPCADAGPARDERQVGPVTPLPGTFERPLRLLNIGSSPAVVTAPQKDTATASPHRLEVDTAEDLAAALDILSHDGYDAILLELPLPDSQGLSALGQLRVRIGTTPIFVCTEHSDEATAIEWLRRGADDYFVKSEVDARWLIRSTRLAVARRTRQYAGIRRESPSKARGFERSSVSSMPSAAERRVQPRYLLTRPIVAIPVLHGSEPDDARCVEGFTVDISTGGIGFEIAGLEHLPTQLLVVGVEGDDEQMHFASVEASHVRPSHIGLRIGGRLITSGRHPLSDDNLLPSMDLTTYRFTTGLPAETLSRWASLGVLQPVLMDRVLACPQCQAIATFRNGCQACGSIQLSSCQLIHHFACAYVGHVQDFECDREIVCPKCRTRALVVGADYEYLNGPYTCLECDWTDTQLELVGQCLRCHYRFPAHQSFEDELIGYHVNRLDPLAFIRSS